MEAVRVEPLDHLGLIAHMIKDLGLISMIDARIVPDEQEEITPGAAVAGMILHGLGFANRPLSLPPPGFSLTNRSTCCFVTGSKRRCSIASNLAGRSMRSMRTDVTCC
jgi:Domain of unknown function (DUF4277)